MVKRTMLKVERLHLIRERLARLKRQRYAEADRTVREETDDDGETEPVVAETVKQEGERCS